MSRKNNVSVSVEIEPCESPVGDGREWFRYVLCGPNEENTLEGMCRGPLAEVKAKVKALVDKWQAITLGAPPITGSKQLGPMSIHRNRGLEAARGQLRV